MVEKANNEATAEDTNGVPNIDEDVRPFVEIKTRVEDVIDHVVRRQFSNKQYEARAM